MENNELRIRQYQDSSWRKAINVKEDLMLGLSEWKDVEE